MRTEVESGWWRSPWFWGCGGCCLGCVGVPLLLVAVLGSGVFAAFAAIGQSDVMDDALARAQADPLVVEALGDPVTRGFLLNGSLDISGQGGRADLRVPISGPRGSGTLRIRALREAGAWTFEVLEVEVEGRGTVIDLLADPPRGSPGAT